MDFRCHLKMLRAVASMLAISYWLQACAPAEKKTTIPTTGKQPDQFSQTPGGSTYTPPASTQTPTPAATTTGPCPDLANCAVVKFQSDVTKGGKGGFLTGKAGVALSWEITMTPNINIDNRDIQFKITGVPSGARAVGKSSPFKIAWIPDHRATGTIEIIARDMDYCKLKAKEDKTINCDNLDESHNFDSQASVIYQIEDGDPDPAEKEQLAAEQKARDKQSKIAGCLAQGASKVVGIGSDIGDLIGSTINVIAGGDGRSCNRFGNGYDDYNY